jgi:hypothetical protein
MLYKEIITVCSEIHTKHINTLCGQNTENLSVRDGGTYSYHWATKCYTSVILLKPSHLLLYREIIAVCSEIHTKHINALCGQNTEYLYVKAGGTYSNHWATKCYSSVIKTSQLILYREIISVCSEIHTKHINALCGQNTEFVTVKHKVRISKLNF